jgi:hypothetical protein
MLFPVRTIVGLLCGCLVMTSMGCATLRFPFGKERNVKADSRNPVTQILCLWEPGEGRDPKGMPCRGFAGQIYFLAQRGSLPVEVDGDVRIYEFDDQGTEEEQATPLHTFNFDAGSWQGHLINTTLGPTYNIFIPYMRPGSHQANCALRLRLKSKDYPVVFSDLATIQLVGRKKKSDSDSMFTPHGTTEMPAEDAAAVEAAVETLRRTTTISLNGSKTEPASTKPAAAKPATGAIQLAAHEETSDSESHRGDETAQRIRQLEAMVQQLMKQPPGNPNGRETGSQTPADPLPADDTAKPLSGTTNNRKRFTLAKSQESQAVDFSDDTSNDRTRRNDERTVATETPPPRKRVASQGQHPLDDVADDNQPPRRHPLADFDDDSTDGDAKSRRQPQRMVRRRNDETAPRVFPATEESLNSEAGSKDPFESFEPIDTEAVETTAVESDQAARRRVRSITR